MSLIAAFFRTRTEYSVTITSCPSVPYEIRITHSILEVLHNLLMVKKHMLMLSVQSSIS